MSIENIPDILKTFPQWVCVRNGSKVPMQASGESASVGRPDTWSSWGDVYAAVRYLNLFDGVGFVFNGNGIVGIDIDDGYDEDGFITPKAADIILNCHSYTERSRSGRGFHILVAGNLPFDGRNNRDGVEAYQTGRYFILTGDMVYYDRIEANQSAIDYVVEKYFPAFKMGSVGGRKPRVYEPTWERPKGRRVPLRPSYPDIPAGSRNICLTSLGGLMHSIGYSPEAICKELLYVNRTSCHPPLDEREVAQVLRSVVSYRR